jgi:hypothetical protein
MRRLFLCTALLATATQIAAQAATAPATPAPAAKAKSGGASKAEFRVGGFMMSGERSYDFADSVKTATGQIRGLEVLLRAPAVGLYFRSLSGTFGTKGSTTNGLQPQIISADARILLFQPVFTLFGGAGKRCLCSDLANKVYDVVLGGISSTVNIGGSGLRTHISGAFLVAPDKSKSTTPSSASTLKKPSTGLEGEAAIFYRLPRVPLFLTVGYRTEVFTGKTASSTSPEEIRGVRIGGGIQFGGH